MVFVIVVTHNGMKWYDRSFNILKNSTINNTIIVVDNASTDNTISYIKENYPEIIIIESKINLGFAKANNLGIKYALENNAQFVFLLNQDAWIKKDTISLLIDVFTLNSNAGIVSPIHLNGNSTALDNGFVHYMQHDNTPNFISDLYMGKIKPFYETKFINAAAWLMKRSCVEVVGGFDTLLFSHYGEDNNFCQRVLYHNFKIYVCTKTSICHDRFVNNRNYLINKQQQIQELNQKVYFADLNKEDAIIENEIKSLHYRNKRKILKNILLLRFKELKRLIKEIQNENKLFTQIMLSRKVNKMRNKTWINE